MDRDIVARALEIASERVKIVPSHKQCPGQFRNVPRLQLLVSRGENKPNWIMMVRGLYRWQT